MTISNVSIAQISGANIFIDTANGGTVVAVKGSAGSIYELELDNTANVAATYCKLYDLGSGGVSLGTTAPDWVIKVPASTKITLAFPNGVAFGTALSVASVTTGGTAGTTSPSSSFGVKVVYT